MEIFLWITFCLASVIIVICLNRDYEKVKLIFACAYTLFIFSAIGLTILYSFEPSAMDVYRGKTTLEITYKDGVAIDSTVVFKQNK